MTGSLRVLAGIPAALAFVSMTPSTPQQPRIPIPSGEGRALHLATLVSESDVLRNAVIRGDLDTARAAARRLESEAAKPEMALPAGSPSSDAFREAARAIADAPDVERAALGMARLAAACGDCHRTANIHSALRTSASRELGGAVGHMLQHQEAADQLHAGLIEPSEPLWQQGADTLATAPLKKSQLPRDPKLTDAVFAAEKQAHELADRARRAATPAERMDVYGRFLASCAACHRLHERIWGPGVPR